MLSKDTPQNYELKSILKYLNIPAYRFHCGVNDAKFALKLLHKLVIRNCEGKCLDQRQTTKVTSLQRILVVSLLYGPHYSPLWYMRVHLGKVAKLRTRERKPAVESTGFVSKAEVEKSKAQRVEATTATG